MPANATRQTQTNGGSETSVQNSNRTGTQTQSGEQNSTQTQQSNRSASEVRNGTEKRTEKGTTNRTGKTAQSSTRNNAGTQDGTSSQTSQDVTVSERQAVVRKSAQSGGGQQSYTRDDIGMLVSFEIEFTNPLAEC